MRLLVLLCFFALFASLARANELSGRYHMEIQIGDRPFVDILRLDGPLPIPHNFRALSGSLTVADVFTSPLQGTSHCSLWVARCALHFEITAVENGQSFRVLYQAELANYFDVMVGAHPAVLTGKATLENGELLGNFTAAQQLP